MSDKEQDKIASLYIDLIFAEALFIASEMKDFEILHYREDINYHAKEHSKFESLLSKFRNRYSSEYPICLEGYAMEDIKGYYRNIISFLEKRNFEGLENFSKIPYEYPYRDGYNPF